MTREEIIYQGRPFEPNCFETDAEETWYNIGLYDGATASPWISKEETDLLPQNIEILVSINGDSYVAIVIGNEVWLTPSKRLCYANEIDFFAPLPELPEEGGVK